MKVLVRLPNWIGDVVMAEPALRALRLSFPQAEIIALMRSYVLPLLDDSALFDRVIVSKNLISDILSLLKIGADVAFILPNSISSALAPFLSGIPRRIGYATYGRRQLLTDSIPFERQPNGKRKPVPMVDYYLRLVRHFGADTDDEHPHLVASESDCKRAKEYLLRRGVSDKELLVGLNPGAKFGSSKLWIPEYFAELADRIVSETKAFCVLFCAPSEVAEVNRIFSLIKNKKRVINTADEVVDLRTLKGFIKRLVALVTTDTGPRHIAVAFDIPTVVVMGPTDPRYTAKNLEKQAVLRAETLACIACHKKVCPKDRNCMRLITPDMVFDSLIRLAKLELVH
ncbi:MAG: lipopolysaccharide heptosyltransferase II [Planctomycetota bacterium]|nr:lipopolysaccharide heptosyltransferase II [Planctomycetota bacterium]